MCELVRRLTMSGKMNFNSVELPVASVKLRRPKDRTSMTLPRSMSISLPPQPDWRENKTMSERLLHMLEKQISCDVTFEVEGKIYKAHSFMLMSASPVFQEMLSLTKAENRQPIYIRSFDSETFWELLKFIYTEQVTLSLDNTPALLMAAQKYQVFGLINECTKFMQNNINEDTVCSVLEEAIKMDNSQLKQRCLRYIDKDTMTILKSSEFKTLSETAVKLILARDSIVAREEDVFTSLIDWSKAKCKSEHLVYTGKNMKKMMGDLIYLIRFPLMKPQYFTDHIANMDVLSDDEKVDLFRYYFGSPKPELPFSDKPRQWNKRSSGILFIRPHTDIFSQGNLGSNMF